MDVKEFQDYLANFEREVVLAGQEELGTSERVSVALQRFPIPLFVEQVGTHIMSEDIVVFDLYGFKKKSLGFIHALHEASTLQHTQVRFIRCPVIHFASIKFEAIRRLAPELVMQFPDFKKYLLDLRGFNHSYKA
jgi:hypothetical protein